MSLAGSWEDDRSTEEILRGIKQRLGAADNRVGRFSEPRTAGELPENAGDLHSRVHELRQITGDVQTDHHRPASQPHEP